MSEIAEAFDFSTPPERVRPVHSHKLNDEQVKDLTEAFMLVGEGAEMISTKQLMQCMHVVAHTVDDQEMQDIASEFDPDATGEYPLSDFLAIMSRRYSEMTPEDEVILAFRVFDRDGNGYIKETEFRYIITNLGDKLTEDEIEEFIRDADSDTEGNIHYVKFVTMMSER